MSHAARRLISHYHKNINLAKRLFYTGPESTPDYTGQICLDNSDTAKKFQDIYQRVKDLHEGKVFTDPQEKIVDLNDRALYDLDHHVLTKTPEKYSLEVEDKLAYDDIIIGKRIQTEGVKESSAGEIDPDFIRPEVQDLLKKITERNPDVVHGFRPGHVDNMPRVRLLTSSQLKKEVKRKDKEAKKILKMPPVKTERSEIDEVIAIDSCLEGYENSKLVFTDISEDIPNQERFIVVRETDGKLRKATWDERDRMLQVYYPQKGRSVLKPYWSEDLSIPLSNGFHSTVLEQIYGQFETDSREYIQLTRTVYDDIDKNGLYDLLRSTRFYGCMAFYFAKHSSIDGLLRHIINEQPLHNASRLVKIFAHIKPESKTARVLKEQNLMQSDDMLAIVQTYVENDATNIQQLQLCLETLSLNQKPKTFEEISSSN